MVYSTYSGFLNGALHLFVNRISEDAWIKMVALISKNEDESNADEYDEEYENYEEDADTEILKMKPCQLRMRNRSMTYQSYASRTGPSWCQ
ncbi:hypothetical protein ANN_18051 [Periplaneta americana]|uniref:Uncharacterized protein n=1 Tax=Periplaneta americana TaxID=6978 RepID=A0ABQ8SNU4_PERAM|nr:hypothetical protein ANN_18051 [Periplaneta americana]